MTKRYSPKVAGASDGAALLLARQCGMRTELREMISAAAKKYTSFSLSPADENPEAEEICPEFDEYMEFPNAIHTLRRFQTEMNLIRGVEGGLNSDLLFDMCDVQQLGEIMQWFGEWLQAKARSHAIASYHGISGIVENAINYQDLCIMIGNSPVRGILCRIDELLFVIYRSRWDATIGSQKQRTRERTREDLRNAKVMLADMFVASRPQTLAA